VGSHVAGCGESTDHCETSIGRSNRRHNGREFLAATDHLPEPATNEVKAKPLVRLKRGRTPIYGQPQFSEVGTIKHPNPLASAGVSAAIFQMIAGFRISRAIYVAAKLASRIYSRIGVCVNCLAPG
jgi:hypothetical protein